jgi:hypothetical protein
MSLDTALYTDLFTRANANPIGGSWITGHSAGALQLVSDAVEAATAGAGYNNAYYNGTFPANQYSEVTIEQLLSGDAGPTVYESTTAETYYYLSIPAPFGSIVTASIIQMSAGTPTTLGSAPIVAGVGDDFTLEIFVSGGVASLNAYQNGFLFLQATDSTPLTAGKVGCTVHSPTNVSDIVIASWEGGSAQTAITQSTITGYDGTVKIEIVVPFQPSPTLEPAITCAPICVGNLSYVVNTTGGTIEGYQSIYYGFVAIDANGNMSPMSDLIEVLVPTGTNTNQVVISGLNPFDQNAVAFLTFQSFNNPWNPQLLQNATAVPSSSGNSSFTFTDSGLSQIPQLPPSQEITSTRLYWRKTGDTQWTLGNVTQDTTQTSLTFIVPHNIQGQSIDIQLRSVSMFGVETPAGIAPIETFVVTGVTPVGVLITGTSTSPIDITKQGSIPPSMPAFTFTYTSTTSSITLSWSGSFKRADGTSQSSSGSSVAITGLSANTTYYFYPYWDEVSGSMAFASGGVGLDGVAFTSNSNTGVTNQNLQSRLPVSSGAITGATTSSGTGGGGTGGGGTNVCLRSKMLVRTQERGLVALGTVRIGEHLATRAADGRDAWTEIIAIKRAYWETWIRVEAQKTKDAVQITPTHHIITADSEEEGCEAQKLSLNRFIYVKDGVDVIGSLSVVNEREEKLSVSCSPIAMFLAGEKDASILVHNNVPLS